MKALACLCLGTLLAPLCRAQDAAAPPAPTSLSPVIVSENPEAVQRFAVNSSMARNMVDRAILKLTSAPDLGTAWTRLGVTPNDIVGIKITTMGGPLLSSHRPIVQAICDGLQAAGLPLNHIIVWDKDQDDMIRAQYDPIRATSQHVGIASVFPGTGFDPITFYKNELIGTLIWGDSEFINRDDNLAASTRAVVGRKGFNGGSSDSTADDSLDGISGGQTSNKSYYATMVTRVCSKIINVPVLTDNAYTGINGCLSSLALACVDNNRRFQGSPTYGDPAICEILSQNFLRRKVILHVLDAMVAEYAGGPRFNPQFTQSIGAIYVSRDPVAIDSLVLPRLERWRKAGIMSTPIGNHARPHRRRGRLTAWARTIPRRIQLVRIR